MKYRIVDKIKFKICNQLFDQVDNQILFQVDDQIYDQVRLGIMFLDQVKWHTNVQVRLQLNGEIKNANYN
jgi:uncharacterized protein YabE (DUF348 family)